MVCLLYHGHIVTQRSLWNMQDYVHTSPRTGDKIHLQHRGMGWNRKSQNEIFSSRLPLNKLSSSGRTQQNQLLHVRSEINKTATTCIIILIIKYDNVRGKWGRGKGRVKTGEKCRDLSYHTTDSLIWDSTRVKTLLLVPWPPAMAVTPPSGSWPHRLLGSWPCRQLGSWPRRQTAVSPEHLCALFLCLLLVDVLHEHTLVLEDVSLALQVQNVVARQQQHSMFNQRCQRAHQLKEYTTYSINQVHLVVRITRV